MADQTGLRSLHDAHAGALRAFVTSLTADHAAAEDVVQETLLRAWRQGITDDGRAGGARPWLFTVARHLVIDDSRSARRRREVTTDALPDRAAPGSADRTDALFDELVVTDALHSLSTDHRTVVVLAYYGRHSIAQIATDLGLAPGTVKSRLHYALRALRLALQERGVTK